MVESKLPWWVENPQPEIYLTGKPLYLDFENTILPGEKFTPPIDPRVQLVSGDWEFEGEHKFKIGSEVNFDELLDDIDKADFLVGHNIKHECQWLQRMGADLTKIIIYDTQIGEYVLAGNRSFALDLDSVSRRYNGRGKRKLYSLMMDLGVCPSTWPEKWLREYNPEDVHMTKHVFLQQREKLRELGLLPTMFTRCLLTPVLADMERYGMMLDNDRVRTIYQQVSREYNAVMAEMNELTGGINPRSAKQVAEFLYGTLGFSNPDRMYKGKNMGPTNAKALVRLEARNAKQREFLECKKRQSKLEAKLSKSLQKFVDCLDDPETRGILHFQLNQTVTQTHRLSSTGRKHKAQGQNIDREVKPVFKARTPGWKFGEADQSQLEWRTALFHSHDPVGLDELARNEDVHSRTASMLFKKELMAANGGVMPTLVEIKKKFPFWRQEGKPKTFAPVFGAVQGESAEERKYFEWFRSKYPTLGATQDGWCNEVVATGKLVTATGLIFYWPGTKITQKRSNGKWVTSVTNRRNIYNYPIQSLATADIVPIGVVCLWHRMKSAEMQSFLVNTVHDSALGEIAPGEEDQWKELSEQSFVQDTIKYLKDCYGIEWDVPLEAEVKIGEYWNDSDSWKEKWLQ